MNPDDAPEDSNFVENFINQIWKTFGPEDVYSWLTKDDICKYFVTKFHFSSEKAEEVQKGLMMKMVQEILGDVDDNDIYQKLCAYRERFLKEFPQMKKEVEQHIAQLRALADKADKVRRVCTISNYVARSTAIVSGILTIVGIGLAPVTAGVSLGLTATGISLGAASAVTGVTTSIVEKSSIKAIEEKGNELTSTGVDLEETLKRIILLVKSICRGTDGSEKNIRDLEHISANPQVAVLAKNLMKFGKTSARCASEMQKAFKGTEFATSKGVQIAGMATAGLFLLMDVCSVLQQSRRLQKGDKTASARGLREQAAELERKLEELKGIHARLLEDELQEPRAECGAEA